MKKILLILLHIITLIILYLLVIIVNYPYGYVFLIPILGIVLLIDVISFSNHIGKYPLNDYNEYKINIHQDDIADSNNGLFIIKVVKNKSIYYTQSGTKSLRFDMTKCIFPKNYIRAYFIRNFNFTVYNKKHKSIIRIGDSYNLSNNFRYQNLQIEFNINEKKKTYWLVKKNKTKPNLIIREIIDSPFYYLGFDIHKGSCGQFMRIDERIYVNKKNLYKNNKK